MLMLFYIHHVDSNANLCIIYGDNVGRVLEPSLFIYDKWLMDTWGS